MIGEQQGVELTQYLKELRLPAIRECYRDLADQAREEALSYEQYLFGLVETEREARRQNHIARLLRESWLPLEVLFTLLADRYERRSVLLTSNLPFSKWERIFKDPMTTPAAMDRLVHHSIILEFNLPSYRLEQSKRRSEKGVA